MKLYVWNYPYHVEYGGSCLYVIAENEERARELASTAGTSSYGHEPDATSKIDFSKLGVPDRVHNLPHAEVFEWAE